MATILIVDDAPDFCAITCTVLEGASHQVAIAASGSLALESMRRGLPDLVTLDVMMSSVLNGLDLSDRMLADTHLRKIPIVMVSASAVQRWAPSRKETAACPSRSGS